MLLHQLTLRNLLSFRDTTVELRGLNVLIGPNAVGKSNLIEAIGLLQALPVDLSSAILRLGGIRVVCSLAVRAPVAVIQCDGLDGESFYRLEFAEQPTGFTIFNETLMATDAAPPYFQRQVGQVMFQTDQVGSMSPSESVFAEYKNPADQTPITLVGYKFERIRIYREFRTTGDAPVRTGISTAAGGKVLLPAGDNLALVLQRMDDFDGTRERVRAYLHRFSDRLSDIRVRLDGLIARAFIKETGLLEPVPSWRLSDGTLKFLCLLAVLLDSDNMPPMICIEEPEVGLHPDAIQIVAAALVEASERTQLIITTHSEALVDALSDRPEDVLVTERDFDNGTQFRRLDKKRLSGWLERYSLGALWRKGEVGGNRW